MRWYIWSFFVFMLATVLVCTPLLKDPFRNVVDDYDGVFITWSINWASYAITHAPLQLFEAPIFYPLQKTFTFSDPMLTAGLIATPFLRATHEPLVAHTAIIFISYVLMGWFTYLLVFELTRSRLLAMATGFYATFGSYHTAYMGHLHTFMLQGIPLSMYAWLRFRSGLKVGWLWIWAGAFIATAVNSPFSGVLFLAAQGVWVFNRSFYTFVRSHLKRIAPPITLAFGCVVLFYIPYLQASALYHSARSIRDAAHFALSLNEVARSPRGFSYGVLLCLIVLIGSLKRKSLHKEFLFCSIGATIMALGPVLKWTQHTVKLPLPIPLPYALAYYVIPGMNAFRAPARWIVLASFLCVVGASLVVQKSRDKTMLAFLFLLLLLIEKPWSYPVSTLHSRTERAPVYAWLEEHQTTPMTFLPPEIYAMPRGARNEVLRMLDTLPGKNVIRLFNGYSGYAPQERVDALVTLANTFPSEESFRILSRAGIETISVEKRLYETKKIDEIRDSLRVRYEDNQFIVGDISSSN